MVEATTKPAMEYRYLGKTGLRVSVISFGYMTSDSSIDNQKFFNEAVQRALDNGINYFDTAEQYGFGVAEKLLGNALKAVNAKREEIVVSTKIFWGPGVEGGDLGTHFYSYYNGKGVNSVGLSRKHIIEGTRNSLRRLQLDYADIIFCHRTDHNTPLEEVCRAFNWIIENGLAFYWGTSEWDADTIVEAIQICERLNLHAPVVEQVQYNMLYRQKMEKDYRALFEKYGYGTTVWSPLAQGFLAGRYNDGNIPDDTRAGKTTDPLIKFFLESMYFTGEKREQLLKICRGLSDIAKQEGYTQAQVALAWVIASKDTSTLIVGFSKLEHIDQNVKALELYAKWNKTLEDKIETLLGNRPEAQIDFRKFAPFTHRRDIAIKESLR